MFKFTNHKDKLIDVHVNFVTFNTYKSYTHGISIRIIVHNDECVYTLPFPIIDNEILWDEHPDFFRRTNLETLDVQNLKKFCEKIMNLRVF